ncbi:MAG: hypothetical protein N2738_06285 [Thermodesulfovibrionales bacterium]|nr:hypothetical protein [Thermodesulfovibrionales bacterium]
MNKTLDLRDTNITVRDGMIAVSRGNIDNLTGKVSDKYHDGYMEVICKDGSFYAEIEKQTYTKPLTKDDFDLSDELHGFINDALSRLSLLVKVLNSDDTIGLSYQEFEGLKHVINEIYSLLSRAERLYFEVEGR